MRKYIFLAFAFFVPLFFSASAYSQIAVGVVYQKMTEKGCGVFTSAVDAEWATANENTSSLLDLRKIVSRELHTYNPGANIIIKTSEKSYGYIYAYEKKFDAYNCTKKSYAVGFGNNLLEAMADAEREARLYCKTCKLEPFMNITSAYGLKKKGETPTAPQAETEKDKSQKNTAKLEKVETPTTPQIPDPNSLVVPPIDASKIIKNNRTETSTGNQTSTNDGNTMTGVKVNPETISSTNSWTPPTPKPEPIASCNEYAINWYKGYYGESGISFPLKVDVKNAIFSKPNSENGVPLYVIHLPSAQLVEGVSKYDVVLLIPASKIQIGNEIDITDNNLTEEMEGAVGRFRYGIGASAGDNFWSNADAGRNRITGKIKINAMAGNSISGTFSLTAFATGFGGYEDEQRKKYVEIPQGCFSANFKSN